MTPEQIVARAIRQVRAEKEYFVSFDPDPRMFERILSVLEDRSPAAGAAEYGPMVER